MDALKARLEKRRQQGNLRSLCIKADLIDFASNDYLGLAKCPALQQAWLQLCQRHQSHTQIQPISVPGNVESRAFSQKLAAKGFDVRPLLSPTVRRGHERLRICLHAFNTEEEVDTLTRALLLASKH